MNVLEAITDYFHEVAWSKWNIYKCFNHLLEKCEDITSEDCEKIKTELKCHLRSISTHHSMSRKVHDKANKLLNELDQFFQSKKVRMILDERDIKVI